LGRGKEKKKEKKLDQAHPALPAIDSRSCQKQKRGLEHCRGRLGTSGEKKKGRIDEGRKKKRNPALLLPLAAVDRRQGGGKGPPNPQSSCARQRGEKKK